MTRPRTWILAVSVLSVVTAACGTQVEGGASSPSTSSTASAATSGSASSAPSRAPTGTPTPTPTTQTGPHRVYWEDVEPGMCLDTVHHDSDYDFWVVPCATKHDREVIANTTLLKGTDTWPGDRAVSKAANATCEAAFMKYVGIRYDDSHLQFDSSTTEREDWEDGDHTLVCIVFDPAHRTVKHSFKGTRR